MLFMKLLLLFIIHQVSSAVINPNFDISHMLELVNEARAKVGASPLSINNELNIAAQLHSNDQAKMETMSHEGSDGSGPGTRLTALGIDWSAYGENVAWNQRSVDQVMTDWIKSPGHYANIINNDYKKFGAGMNNYYWTQEFMA